MTKNIQKKSYLPQQIKDIFPDKHNYVTGYIGGIIKVSFPDNTIINKIEYDKLNELMTITTISYDKELDRIVFMGYMNGGA